MAKVTGFRCVDALGGHVPCDAHGNNVAFQCPACGGPVLATLRENQRGSAADRPSECPGCHARYWAEADVANACLTVRRII